MRRFNTPSLRQWAQPSLISLALAASIAQAAPGDLDTGFGGTGLVTTEIGNLKDGVNYANAVLQQADGKVVVAGASHNGANNDFSLIRYTTTGAVDTTFNADGRVTLAIGTSNDVIYGIIQQADGKLVVAGTATMARASGISDSDIALARFNTDGSLDATFGTNGLVVTPVTSGDDEGRGLIQQTDGKLVIAGYGQNGATKDIVVVRYSSNGVLDSGFGTGGKVITAVLASDDFGYSVAQQGDGKLVVSGDATATANTDIAVVRYNSNGTLDTSFDTDGKTTLNIGSDGLDPPSSEDDHAFKVGIQADGSIVIAGGVSNGTNTDFLSARFTSTGALDTTFNATGYVKTSVNAGNDGANALVIQPDGKLLLAGYSTNGTNNDFATVRYNTDGSLDTSYSTDGIQLNPVNAANDVGYAAAQQADSKLLVAGITRGTTNDDAGLIRMATDGTLDTTFNTVGRVTTTAGSAVANVTAMTRSGSKLIAVGNAYTTAGNTDAALARYNADGSLDTTFSGDGLQITSYGTTNDFPLAATVQADGKIVIAGYRDNTSSKDIIMARYLTDGTPDSGYASSGKYSTGVSIGNHDVINSVIQLKNSGAENGKLLAAGYINSSTAGNSSDFGLMRFRTTGSKDNTYDLDGSLTTPIGLGADIANDLVEQPDGKIVAVGQSFEDATGNIDVALVRYNINGTLDTSFDTDGKITVDVNGGDDIAQKVVLLPDGDIVIAGSAATGSNVDILIGRFNSDGSVDTTFGTNGFTRTAVGTLDDFGYALAMQPDGKFVVSGTSVANTSNAAVIVRYNNNGALDTAFGTGGKALIDTSKQDASRGMVIQSDGKYAIAGSTTGPNDFFAARVLVEDADTDGLGDAYDNCPVNANADQADFDADQIGDVCDSDADGDSVADTSDNCLMLSNADQLDTDGDLQGNACDSDDDNDSVVDGSDAFPLNPAESVDTDSDGVGNNADGDDDGDGAADTVDTDPLNAAVSTEINLPLDSNYDGATIKDNQTVQ